MVKGKVIGLGLGIIAGFLIFSFLAPGLGFELEFLASPYVYILILLSGGLIAVAGFLPYNWGKILKEIAIFCLFILLLLTEMNLVKPFVKATKIEFEACKSLFFPSTEGKIVYDALKYASCVLTGYFPTEESDLGWTAFYIFYIILPFAFAWTFLYALMKEVMRGWITGVGINVEALLSFIIAMYAARVMFGAFLLDFAGYGAWGLAGLFIAVFFSKAVSNIMDSWYGWEKMAQETKQAIEAKLNVEKLVAAYAIPILEEVKRLANIPEVPLDTCAQKLGGIKETPLWNMLPDVDQKIIEYDIMRAMNAAGRNDRKEFLAIVNGVEKYLKKIATLKLKVKPPSVS